MKKFLVLFILMGFGKLVLSQDNFDHLKSNQGYDKILEWDMNNGLGIQAYRFISQSDNSLHFQSKSHNSWTTNAVFKTGRLGIGTTSPVHKLDVNGTAQVSKMIINPSANGSVLQMGTTSGFFGQRQFNFTSSGDFAGFTILSSGGTARLTYSSNTTSNWLGLKEDSGTEIFKVAKEPGLATFIHLPQADSRMVIGSHGTYLADEGYKFVVKDGDAIVQGKVVAEEVIVSLTVPPDYVFEKYYTGSSSLNEDYVMPTLKEVAAYTQSHHHLPGVPSAKEIQEEGAFGR